MLGFLKKQKSSRSSSDWENLVNVILIVMISLAKKTCILSEIKSKPCI